MQMSVIIPIQSIMIVVLTMQLSALILEIQSPCPVVLQ